MCVHRVSIGVGVFFWRAMAMRRFAAITALLGAATARSLAPVVAARKDGEMSTAAYVARVGLAGAISCSVTHSLVVPLDNVKTTMQTMPELGPVRAAAQVVRERGSRALLNGLRPTAVGYWLQGAAKFGGYEALKLVGRQLFWTRDGEVHVPATLAARLPLMLTAAGVAEMGACLLLCPLETGAHPHAWLFVSPSPPLSAFLPPPLPFPAAAIRGTCARAAASRVRPTALAPLALFPSPPSLARAAFILYGSCPAPCPLQPSCGYRWGWAAAAWWALCPASCGPRDSTPYTRGWRQSRCGKCPTRW
jgi:hypothetical protein